MPGGTQVPNPRGLAFVYRTVTFFGGLSHTLRLTRPLLTRIGSALQPLPRKRDKFGLLPVRSPLLWEFSLFLWVLRCFSSPGAPLTAYVFSGGYPGFTRMGFPIRRPPDRCLFTTPRSFSQCPTSFFGTWRLGIHHQLLVASSRDAEICVLLTSSTSSSAYFSFYALVKVLPGARLARGHRLDGGGCSSCFHQDHPAPANLLDC